MINLLTTAIISGGINFTVVFSIITICLAVMGTLVKIFGNKRPLDENKVRNSEYIKSLSSHFEEHTKEKDIVFNSIKDQFNNSNMEIEKLKIEISYIKGSIQDLKEKHKETVNNLNVALNKLMQYVDKD